MGCKWEHNEKWFPFLDPLVCLNITDCHWKTAARQFEWEGDIVTQNTVNLIISMESGLPSLQEAEHPQARLKEVLVLLLCGCEGRQGWHWGSVSQGHRPCTHSPSFLPWCCSWAVALLRPQGLLAFPSGSGPGVCCWCGVRHRLCSSCRSAELLLLLLLPGWSWAAVGAGAFCGNHCCPLASSPDFCLPLTEETCAASILWGSKSTFCPSESRAVNLKGWY